MIKLNGRKLLTVLVAALLLIEMLAVPALSATEIAGVIVQDRMLIPLRAVSESLGAKVVWNGPDKDIEIQTSDRTVALRLNSERARVNGQEIALDSPARLMGGKTYVPLRFVSEALGAKVEWNQNDRSAGVILGSISIRVTTSGGGEIRHYTYGSADVVEIPRGSGCRAMLALGWDQVGSTESLESMAGRYGAAAAINGTFFEAYNKGDYKPPTGWSLIRNGRLVTFGGNRHTMFGFTDDGQVKVALPEVMIWGGTNGSYTGSGWWDAANVNGMPIPESNRIAVFTREYGPTLAESGTMVVVTHGRVTQITQNQAVAIPDDGFVILDQRSDPDFLGRFQIGTAVSYKPELQENGVELDWSDVVTGIEMGPTLVRDGAIVVDPVSEGFEEAKILSASGQRSALGVKANGDVILLVSPNLTIWQLAQVMSELGARDAINLDGGASSGLYLNGQYIQQPGRELSNALLFVPK